MQKKGLWFFATVLILVIAAIFYFKDGRNMDKVEKEQLESAADSADSKLDLLNDDFDDMDFDDSEIEEAELAYDTLQ
ncbi:MAG: hypothetical protein AB8B72_05730 [Crocinitomicaceae bacterium]